jgi:hypothetical protein
VRDFASPEFWAAYRRLPENIRNLADKNFALLKADPRHPSLHFKPLGPTIAFASACVTARWRWMSKMGCFGSGSVLTPTMMHS